MFSVPATVTRNSIQPQSHFTSQYMYGEQKRKSPHAVGAVHHRLAHLAEHEVLETERSQKAAHEHDGAHTLLTDEHLFVEHGKAEIPGRCNEVQKYRSI